ncbi:hypothetical protein AB3S75_026996 [Citrus x aurantiifolia]
MKYFSSFFARGRKLKAEPRKFWCPFLCLFFIFLQFYFSCVSASPTNFRTEIISEAEIIYSGCVVLPRLKKLTLHHLPGLVNIWSRAWPLLEYVSFYDCPRLKNIGLDSNLKHSIMEIKAEKSWWDDLELGRH